MSKAKEKRRAICYDYLSDEIEALNRQNVELKAQLSENKKIIYALKQTIVYLESKQNWFGSESPTVDILYENIMYPFKRNYMQLLGEVLRENQTRWLTIDFILDKMLEKDGVKVRLDFPHHSFHTRLYYALRKLHQRGLVFREGDDDVPESVLNQLVEDDWKKTNESRWLINMGAYKVTMDA